MAYPGNSQFSGLGEPANSYAQQKRAFETYWQGKILDALTMYPGLVVGVNVDLDPALAAKAERAIHIAATGTHSTARDRGADGTIDHAHSIISNHPRSVMADISTPIASSTYGQQTGRNSLQRRTETDSLSPGFVSAAISFPRSYLIKVWRTNQSLTPKAATDQPTNHELQAIEGTVSDSIKQTVVNLLPPVPTSKGDKHVTVHIYDDFQTPFATASDASDASAGPTRWFAENWQILTLFGLAILGFVLIRYRIQHHQEDLTSPEAAHDSGTVSFTETMAETSAPDSNKDPSFSHQPPSENDEPDFQSELTNLVKDNPDAAAEILRRWIGDVA
jgi:flagellar M-ring protein FliF